MYRIRGGDGLEYGPIDADKVAQWIRERRLERASLIFKEGETEWRALGTFPEFSVILLAVETPPSLTPPPPGRETKSLDMGVDEARNAVGVPAILLAVYGGLSLLTSLLNLLSAGAGAPWNSSWFQSGYTSVNTQGMPPEMAQFFHSLMNLPKGVNYADSILSLVIAAGVLWGAIEMKRLGSRSLAITGAILALIPCIGGCCCCIGIPLGIWALTLLTRPSIARHYQ